LVAGAGRPTFRIGPGPASWPGVVAFGGFAIQRIEVPGATLSLALLDGPPPEHQARMQRWIERAARHVTRAYGSFPVASLQIIVVPTTQGSGPVPWAYVARGGGPAVHLFINPSHQPAAFDRDWTATHEMAHLFLPYVAPPDAWLFEGLPTYMQNVLMVRGGAIAVAEGWKRMIVGFQRGERSGTGLSVAQASERIGVGGNYLRVYWAGAAMMLEADLRLREQSQDTQSLDTALAALAECCLAGERRWSAEEVMARLDVVTGSTVFSDVMREQFASAGFPDFKRTLVRAGVTVRDGEVVLDPSAPGAPFREALMRPQN
jgi:sorbitol-specific phosphotransferase system component IIC